MTGAILSTKTRTNARCTVVRPWFRTELRGVNTVMSIGLQQLQLIFNHRFLCSIQALFSLDNIIADLAYLVSLKQSIFVGEFEEP